MSSTNIRVLGLVVTLLGIALSLHASELEDQEDGLMLNGSYLPPRLKPPCGCHDAPAAPPKRSRGRSRKAKE